MACKNALPSMEKDRILAGEEEPVHDVNIGNMILNALKSRPDFIGQIDAETDEQTTYRQMLENSVKCALWLKKEILHKNIVISICTCHQMLSYIPFLAGLYIGAIINPWDPKYFEDETRVMYFLVEYEPEVIFIDKNNYLTLVRVIQHLNISSQTIIPPKIITFGKVEGIEDTSLELILKGRFDKSKINKFYCKDYNPMEIMATMFSATATNYPGKTHIRYYAFTYPSNQEVPAMSSGDIGLWYGSLSWPYSLILTVRSIVSHVTVIKCLKFYDENMYNAIEKYKVKWVFLQSEMCNQLFRTDIRMYNVSSLKQLVFGDSAIDCNIYKKLIEHFTNASIVQVYSISEAGIIVAYQRNSNRIGSSGHLAKNVNLIIINDKKTVGPNVLGEIWYKLVCKWCDAKTCKLPYCNSRRRKDNNMPISTPITATWHCTGDYGYYEEDREIFIIDKTKHLINYRMFRISPIRIENVLRSHPAVSEVIVKAVPDSKHGQVPMAYVTIRGRIKVTELLKEKLAKELMKLITESLPDMCKLRGGLYFKKDMPYLPNGKIDRELVQSY
ncbi:luciferin 4-monooxygenase-like [Solenopsis invicta]|uniref:luciferin 4-monooxygenase-like n=1 Tax=Solenopsis invicta TaxID=13686 RepID=UPI00193D35DD|nr:luciferin 4-monooxygenase-like [Solenopsis invicta]